MCMLKKLIKKIIWNIRGGYKPKEFWDMWSKTFMDDLWQRQIHPQHEWILKKVLSLRPKEILEVGCGFGRNIKFLIEKGINPGIITGVDLSPKILAKAKEYIKNNKVKLMEGDVKNLPFQDRNFDLTLVHGVFMHVKPDDVEKAVKEVAKVTKKDLIVVEQNYGGNEFTFIHDYSTLFKNFNVAEYIKNDKLGLDFYHVKIRKN